MLDKLRIYVLKQYPMKCKRVPVIFCLILFFRYGGILSSLPEQMILYPGDWVYDGLTTLSLEQRIVFFTGRSIKVSQAKMMLDQLDRETLSPSGQNLYDTLSDFLDSSLLFTFSLGAFGFGFDPVVEPEAYFSTSQNGPWIYDNYRRKPFAALPVSIDFSQYLAIRMDAAMMQQLNAPEKDNNYGNFFLNYLDFNIPRRAFLSLSFPLPKSSSIDFAFGIGEEYIGRTRLGSIILSDRLKDITYGSLGISSPAFHYSANILQIEQDKYFYNHQLEVRFLKRLSMYVVEGLLVNAPMELRYLNPLMIFHSFHAYGEYSSNNANENPALIDNSDSRVSSYFGTRFELQLIKYGRIYGLLALNEIQTMGEKLEEPHALKADSMGFQVGSEWFLPASIGYVTFGVEGVYTYPFLYVQKDKRWSFYKGKTGKSGSVSQWMGFPYGPDSAAATLWAGYSASTWSAEVSFVFVAQGERSSTAIFNTDDYHPWLTKNFSETLLSSPSGTPMFTYQVSLGGTWSPMNWLAFAAYPGYWIRINDSNKEGEVAQGFETTLSIKLIPEFLRRSL